MKLVTGANGFVGGAVVKALKKRNIPVVGTVRNNAMEGEVVVGDICERTDWRPFLVGVDTIIHTAARVHVMDNLSKEIDCDFYRVNVEGTLCLAKQAVEAGVKRFIFISSIKVNGEENNLGKPYVSSDIPLPLDPYGLSKYKAEQELIKLSKQTALEIVIIRPVLVYGPGVKANFLKLIKLVNTGLPMPFGGVANKRSLVAIDNLVDLILTCIDHPAAKNNIFLVSDDEDLSTKELFQKIAKALGKPVWMVTIPPIILKAILFISGNRSVAQRLLGTLQVDITPTKEILSWAPPIGVDQALRETVADYLANV